MSHDELMIKARQLLERGVSDRAVGRELGVPQTTVSRWRRGETLAFGPAVAREPWRAPNPAVYAYLLGIYLGDGHVTVGASGEASLRVYLDAAYPGIVDETVSAIVITSRGRKTQTYDAKDSRGVLVQCRWERWPEAFPQHVPGQRHRRSIVLAGWQQEIVDAHPGPLVRGLIHSDGCRTINRFKTTLPSGRVAKYAYPRYFFSNLSPEIRQLFRDACETLGVKTTMSNARNVSVSHRESVAVLEEIVGPKE